MPAGPDFISLQVRDLDAAAAFYEDRVGLRRAPASPPGAVVFASEPIPLAVREPLPDTDLDSGQPFGRTFALRDPDGYAVTIHDAA
jgi:catechol 2,3-dioxygenase-like lactoylglutathione lyase family enzyme